MNIKYSKDKKEVSIYSGIYILFSIIFTLILIILFVKNIFDFQKINIDNNTKGDFFSSSWYLILIIILIQFIYPSKLIIRKLNKRDLEIEKIYSFFIKRKFLIKSSEKPFLDTHKNLAKASLKALYNVPSVENSYYLYLKSKKTEKILLRLSSISYVRTLLSATNCFNKDQIKSISKTLDIPVVWNEYI